jgi:zf-MYND-like zinc finger, mRNA-binding
MSAAGACASPGCTNVTTQRLACPKCLELGLAPTYFCGQACFKANYNEHKQVHAIAKQVIAAQQQRSVVDVTAHCIASHRID